MKNIALHVEQARDERINPAIAREAQFAGERERDASPRG
jgi:hypothetical protein